MTSIRHNTRVFIINNERMVMWAAWARTWLIDQPSRTGVVGIYQTWLCWCHRSSYATIQSYELPWLDHSTWRSGSWTCSELESIRTVTKNYAENEATYQVVWLFLFWFNVLRYSFLKICHCCIVLRRWLGNNCYVQILLHVQFDDKRAMFEIRRDRYFWYWHIHSDDIRMYTSVKRGVIMETRCLHLNC